MLPQSGINRRESCLTHYKYSPKDLFRISSIECLRKRILVGKFLKKKLKKKQFSSKVPYYSSGYQIKVWTYKGLDSDDDDIMIVELIVWRSIFHILDILLLWRKGDCRYWYWSFYHRWWRSRLSTLRLNQQISEIGQPSDKTSLSSLATRRPPHMS